MIVTLADQIIEHGPYVSGDSVPWTVEGFRATEMNALRDELIELRKLRAAAEARERYEVHASPWRDAEGADLVLDCTRCIWHNETSHDVSVNDAIQLGALVRRADEHTEECGR